MTDWMGKAACKSHDADIFHTTLGRGTARHICLSHCTVRTECDVWARGQGGWSRQTLGGLWWVSKRRAPSEPAESQSPPETTYCKSCNPDCPDFPRPDEVDPEPACPVCGRVVDLGQGGEFAWHTSGESGVCLGSGRTP